MPQGLEAALRAVMIGVGATAILDLWAVLATRVFGMPAPRWDLVGRWVGYFPRGRFVHAGIGQAQPIRGELMIGWLFHYSVGIFYAGLLVAISGLDWARHPTLFPALILSFVTLAVPFFLMQPAMGAGIAASRTPNPNAARLRSVIGHTVFGLGLYLSAVLTAWLIR